MSSQQKNVKDTEPEVHYANLVLIPAPKEYRKVLFVNLTLWRSRVLVLVFNSQPGETIGAEMWKGGYLKPLALAKTHANRFGVSAVLMEVPKKIGSGWKFGVSVFGPILSGPWKTRPGEGVLITGQEMVNHTLGNPQSGPWG
ncbi:MAG TPA: hypothetical protein VLH19_02330 [Patescibacteria group bacterium]|nr:hypothetical protein [Patescibacteria group bacterium]